MSGLLEVLLFFTILFIFGRIYEAGKQEGQNIIRSKGYRNTKTVIDKISRLFIIIASYTKKFPDGLTSFIIGRPRFNFMFQLL